MATRQFSIDARTVPAPRNGGESSGRQIVTFVLAAYDAEVAACTATRILLDVHPDMESVTALATERGVVGERETFTHTRIKGE